MIKQDETEFFNHLIEVNKENHEELRANVIMYPINEKRKQYILEKWCDRGIWDYGVSAQSGWFENRAEEIFNEGE